MTDRVLYLSWAALYALTAGLGFVPNPEGWLLALLRVCSLLFFLPPALLLRRARRENRPGPRALVHRLAVASLCATATALIANVLCAGASRAVGTALHALLVLVSAPMECSHLYAMSLFLWACLMMATFPEKKKSR